MTRRNKHAARFGARYRSKAHAGLPVGFSFRKFADAITDALPAIHRMTATLRQVADNMRRAGVLPGYETLTTSEAQRQVTEGRTIFRNCLIVPDVANMAAPTVAELEAGTPIRLETESITITGPYRVQLSSGRSILDRIDDTLLTYDSQHADGTEPWPYRGF